MLNFLSLFDYFIFFSNLEALVLLNYNMKPSRLAVYVADLQRMTGQSERSCQRMLNKIRDLFGLQKRQFVTIYQVSEYTGMPVEDMVRFMQK